MTAQPWAHKASRAFTHSWSLHPARPRQRAANSTRNCKHELAPESPTVPTGREHRLTWSLSSIWKPGLFFPLSAYHTPKAGRTAVLNFNIIAFLWSTSAKRACPREVWTPGQCSRLAVPARAPACSRTASSWPQSPEKVRG